MKRRRIGSLEVSIVGIGCNNFGWRLDAAGTADVVESALDEGINFFDTADMYGGTKSEDFLGRALGRRRDEAVIATKFGWEIDSSRRGAHPDYVHHAVDDSLKRLGTDHIDLDQLPKPDPDVPIRDTLGALEDPAHGIHFGLHQRSPDHPRQFTVRANRQQKSSKHAKPFAAQDRRQPLDVRNQVCA